MPFLIDENMPRSLAALIAALGFTVKDVRDIGLRGRSDSEVFDAGIAADAIIITRDRGFVAGKDYSSRVVEAPHSAPSDHRSQT